MSLEVTFATDMGRHWKINGNVTIAQAPNLNGILRRKSSQNHLSCKRRCRQFYGALLLVSRHAFSRRQLARS